MTHNPIHELFYRMAMKLWEIPGNPEKTIDNSLDNNDTIVL
jgi:hypothetical protein